MEYTEELITREISRLEIRLEQEQSALASAILRRINIEENISHYEATLAELRAALQAVKASV